MASSKPPFCAGVRQVAEGVDVVGPLGDRAADQVDAGVNVAGLARQGAQEVQGIRMPWLPIQDLAIDLLGGKKIAGLVEKDRVVQGVWRHAGNIQENRKSEIRLTEAAFVSDFWFWI